MKMTEKRPFDEAALDELFASAHGNSPLPSADLVGRILADAEAVQAVEVAVTPAPSGLWTRLLQGIGGWPSAVGLASAAMAGVVIGFTSLETLDSVSGGYLSVVTGYGVTDLMPSFGDLIEGG